MKNRKKFLLLAILVFLISASFSGAYAYWAGTVNAPDQKTNTIAINIGEGGVIDTEITLNPLFGGTNGGNKVLVPTGQIPNSVAAPAGKELVDKVEITYGVEWKPVSASANITGTEGTISVALDAVTIGGDTAHADLVKVEYKKPGISAPYESINGAPATYIQHAHVPAPYTYIRVTLEEPVAKATYEAIIGKEIVIKLKFSVTVNP